MSREEEIEQQAKSLYYHFCIRETCEGEDNCTNCLHGKVIEPLVTMAKWADKHPREGLVDVEKVCNWISVRTPADEKVSSCDVHAPIIPKAAASRKPPPQVRKSPAGRW